jgi:acyl-CoA synthetase (AMP-forming)/AMP-acid ligase II
LEKERVRTCPGNVPVSVGSLSPQAASITADGLFTGRVRRSPLLTNAMAGREKMPTGNRSGWPEYHRAFEGRDEDFLFYYDADSSGRITEHCWRRDEFWQTAGQAAAVLRESRLRAGDRFCLCVGANQPLDLAFRLAAVMTGSIPVTVNWQADTVERVCYKIRLTESRLIVADDIFKPADLAAVQQQFPDVQVFRLSDLDSRDALKSELITSAMPENAARLIVFTSGTTGQPKGVGLPYRAYRANRATFEQFLQIEPDDRFAVVIVNPLHHSNSSAITDWAARRPGTHIHMLSRYTTAYWKILARVAERDYDRIVAPTVSRHFDFLEELDQSGRLPIPAAALKRAMGKVDFLIGSAPVGPTTIERLLKYTGRIPAVRFGATETCLQSIGIPMALPENAKLAAFEKGWQHTLHGSPRPGYYIGRPHRPHTGARIVRSIEAGEAGCMVECPPGRPGYIVVRGQNLMSGYIREPEKTRGVFHGAWYTGLKDIGYTLVSEHDGELDYYWMSRDSTMLIRGGANYAYDQINHEIQAWVEGHYGLTREDVDLAVVGLKVDSEHEDACCLTLEIKTPRAERLLAGKAAHFKHLLNQNVSKNARIDYLRLDSIPRNFKGAVQVKQLVAAFDQYLKGKKQP